MKQPVTFTCNGTPVTILADGGDLLIDLLREQLHLTGTKEGCGRGECGACTVLVDGRPVNACLYPGPEIGGREVTTIEGLVGEGHSLSEVQQAFVEHGGIQCGFCTPGMILTAHALLQEHPDPSDVQIRDALAGNLCRCTGYVQIIESVQAAARALRGKRGAR